MWSVGVCLSDGVVASGVAVSDPSGPGAVAAGGGGAVRPHPSHQAGTPEQGGDPGNSASNERVCPCR